MATLPARATPKASAAAPIAPTMIGGLLRSLAVIYRLDLSGPSADALAAAYRDTIGEHPEDVVRRAGDILRATRTFPTFPTPAEIVGAILSAYEQLGVPMSPDAARLAELRQTSDRYVAGPDGRKRFLPGLTLGVLHFQKLTGHHGNGVLEAVPIATVEHVERAVREVSDRKPDVAFQSGGRKDATLGWLLSAVELRAFEVAAFERYGAADAQCGGPVAVYGVRDHSRPPPDNGERLEFASRWVCLSQAVVDSVLDGHPMLAWRPRDIPQPGWPKRHVEPADVPLAPPPCRDKALARLRQAFRSMTLLADLVTGPAAEAVSEAKPDPHGRERWRLGVRHYGTGLQQAFEAAFRGEAARLAGELAAQQQAETERIAKITAEHDEREQARRRREAERDRRLAGITLEQREACLAIEAEHECPF